MIADVPRETADRLARLTALIIAENEQQNLVSAGTIADFEMRHIQDSLQLLPHINPGPLIDIGSGAGFPGLVLACVRADPIHLVEPRARRADFLRRAAGDLGVAGHVTVHACKVERLGIGPVATITARAVAALPALFAMAHHLCDERTRWVLPKGQSVSTELAEAQRTWQGDFRLIPSMTDARSAILLAEALRRRTPR